MTIIPKIIDRVFEELDKLCIISIPRSWKIDIQNKIQKEFEEKGQKFGFAQESKQHENDA